MKMPKLLGFGGGVALIGFVTLEISVSRNDAGVSKQTLSLLVVSCAGYAMLFVGWFMSHLFDENAFFRLIYYVLFVLLVTAVVLLIASFSTGSNECVWKRRRALFSVFYFTLLKLVLTMSGLEHQFVVFLFVATILLALYL